jgi:hypothetical protein
MKRLFLIFGFGLAVLTVAQAQVSIGAVDDSAGGALLSLKEIEPSDPQADNATASKGVIFPRVALGSLTELYPIYSPTDPDYSNAQKRDSLKRAYTGLTVYNPMANTNNGFVEGLYVWDGVEWIRPITQLPDNAINSMALKATNTTTGGENEGKRGTPLNFVDVAGNEGIQIPVTGAYAFNVSLCGSVNVVGRTGNDAAREVYYISLHEENNGSTDKKDIAEINLRTTPTASTNTTYSYTIVMSGTFKKGSKVIIQLSHHEGGYGVAWTLKRATNFSDPANTTLSWWKL